MEIKIYRDELYRAISRVQSIIEKRSNMPILSMILLSTDDSHINISATDLEISFQQRLSAKSFDGQAGWQEGDAVGLLPWIAHAESSSTSSLCNSSQVKTGPCLQTKVGPMWQWRHKPTPHFIWRSRVVMISLLW